MKREKLYFSDPNPDKSNKNMKQMEGIPEELISKKTKYIAIEFDGAR